MTKPTWRDVVGTLAFLIIMLALFDITVRRAWGEELSTLIVTINAEGYVIRTVARTDNYCPFSGCNSTMTVDTRGAYPSRRTYEARTTVLSTGKLETDLIPLPRGVVWIDGEYVNVLEDD